MINVKFSELPYIPRTTDANPDGKGCLPSKLIKESEKIVIIKSYAGIYVLFFLCSRRTNCMGNFVQTVMEVSSYWSIQEKTCSISFPIWHFHDSLCTYNCMYNIQLQLSIVKSCYRLVLYCFQVWYTLKKGYWHPGWGKSLSFFTV